MSINMFNRKRMFVPLLCVAGLLLFQLVSCKNKTVSSSVQESVPVVDVPVFNADSAYSYMQKQVDFGYRIPNTPEHLATASYLASELNRHGAEVQVQDADVVAFDGTVLHAKNIIGIFSPEKTDRILLFAHWDSRPFADNDPDEANHRKPVLGANDGASGVGALLEIARQIGMKSPQVGVDIIFFDAEDYGQPYFSTHSEVPDSWALGTQYWVRRPHRPGYRARFGILLDMVGGENAVFAREKASLQYAPGIVDKVWKKAQSLGYGKYFSDNEGGYIIDDHVYVNKMGIPSIDIIQYDASSDSGFNPQWHTVHDTMDHIDKETLKAVGQTVLAVIYNE